MKVSRAWLAFGLLGWASFSLAAGCDSSNGGGNAAGLPGAEGQACRPDGTCDPGLSCLSNLCVNAGAAGSGSGGSGSGSGGTDSSGGAPSNDPGGAPGDAGSTGTGATGGDDGQVGMGGGSGFPTEPSCRNEGEYLICPHAGFTWTEAESYCQSQGGHLVKIDNPGENTTLGEAVTEGGSIWIGASDLENEGQFRWPDGSEVSAPNASWADGQPNDSDGEDCVVMHADGGDWNDVDCVSTEFGDLGMSFVCDGI